VGERVNIFICKCGQEIECYKLGKGSILICGNCETIYEKGCYFHWPSFLVYMIGILIGLIIWATWMYLT